MGGTPLENAHLSTKIAGISRNRGFTSLRRVNACSYAATREATHANTSLAIHPTARLPIFRGRGKLGSKYADLTLMRL